MKKKWYSLLFTFSERELKIMRVMKLALVMLIISSLQLSASVVFSQTDGKLDINVKKTRISDVLNEVEEQTDYKFAYSSKFIDTQREISLNLKQADIKDVLDKIFENTEVAYKMEDNFVILLPKYVADEWLNKTVQQTGKTITGVVTDNSGHPIPGVSVVVKNTTIGTITDIDGKYQLPNIEEDVLLVFSFIGMEPQEKSVAGITQINVEMIESLFGLNEVIVIGYGTVKKSDLTGSVGVLRAEEIDKQINSNLGTAIQGKIAGVNVQAAGGAPGAGMVFTIRGAGSLNNNNPLILVDDVPVSSMNNINPNDIESIQVLKDASAAAIYGSRAANGVVLIVTKSGKKGPTKINIDADFAVQQIGKTLDLCNTDEWIKIVTEACQAGGIAVPAIALNPEVPGNGIDWQDRIFRSAPVQNISFNASGGSDHLNYSLSLGYLNQEGIIKETDYNRMNLRFKTDFTKGRFKIGESVILSREKVGNQPGVGGQGGNVIGAASLMVPAFAVYNDAAIGGYGGASGAVLDIFNPVAALYLKNNEDKYLKALINLYTEVELIKGLKYKFNVGLSTEQRKNTSTEEQYEVGSFFRNKSNYLYEMSGLTDFWQIENTLSFNREFGKHSFNAVVGQTASDYNYSQFSAAKRGMPDEKWVLDAGADEPAAGGNKNENTMTSYLGRLIYSFDSKYIFTGTYRRDGSSRFSPLKKWGNFPSVSFAWNAANESFIKDNIENISQLKLRASYGKLGNQEIGDYQYMALITSAISYGQGEPNSLWVGNIQTDYAPKIIIWETTATSNFGVDLGLYNGKINFNFDVFKKTTTDLLLRVPIPLSAGADNNPYANAGKVANNGYELLMNYNGKVNDFSFSVTGTLSHVKNEVKELSTGSQELAGGNATHGGSAVSYTKVGYPMYSFFLIKTDGLFRSDADILAHSKDGELIQPNAQIGDIRFKDANDDGMIDGNDRVYCGSPFPDIEFGLRLEGSWKQLDATVFFQGTNGNKIYNGISTYTESGRFTSNYSRKLLNSYSFNPNSNIPRLDMKDSNGNGVDNSDRFLEDGSYIRLKTVQLGYTLPSELLNRLAIEKCRFYIGAQNLFTNTDYSGYNADIGNGGLSNRGIDFRQYPLNRSYHIGLQVSF